MSQTQAPITIGPENIKDIGRAVERLLPWLAGSRYQMRNNGALVFQEEEPAEALAALRGHVEAALPLEIREQLGAQSGLGWENFMGHVVTWWLPQRNRLGLLKALVDRAALHHVDLRLHWNQGRKVPTKPFEPGAGALVWGGILGLIGAFISTRAWPREPLLPLMILAGGVVVGRIYQRLVTLHRCGDPLCQAQLRGEETCPSCGADVAR